MKYATIAKTRPYGQMASVGVVMLRLKNWFVRRHLTKKTISELKSLSDHQLADIGVRRFDIEYHIHTMMRERFDHASRSSASDLAGKNGEVDSGPGRQAIGGQSNISGD